jgi:hypothetical protein
MDGAGARMKRCQREMEPHGPIFPEEKATKGCLIN